MSPSTLKHFQIIKQVGKGAFGTVFQATRKSDGKTYAIKVINIAKMDKKTIQSTLNEIRILSSVVHPNIVGYKEAFLEKNDTEMCIVMEYVGGGDLAGKIADCKKRKMHLNEEVIWKYLIQTLIGLKVLHEMKIIHRDIKSANLFLSTDFETIKLGDLNVAKVAKNDLAQTQIGTPYYLAPEIWNNQIYTYKCDIFSLGVVLYEMAALAVPFEAYSIAELCKKITKGVFNKIPSRYSEDLYSIIKAMLIKDPKQRPSTEQLLAHPVIQAKMMAQNIQQYKHKEGINALVGTILLPKNLNQLNKVLPKQKRYMSKVHSMDDLTLVMAKEVGSQKELKKEKGANESPQSSVHKKQLVSNSPKVASKPELSDSSKKGEKADKLPPVKGKPMPPAKSPLAPKPDAQNTPSAKKSDPIAPASGKKVEAKPKVVDYQDYASRAAEAKKNARARVSSADKRVPFSYF